MHMVWAGGQQCATERYHCCTPQQLRNGLALVALVTPPATIMATDVVATDRQYLEVGIGDTNSSHCWDPSIMQMNSIAGMSSAGSHHPQ